MVLWTTVHESFHALAALLAGGSIERFVVWPSVGDGGRLLFGWVSYDFPAAAANPPYAWITAAPYLGDVAIALAGLALLRPPAGSRRATAVLILVFAGAFYDALNAWHSFLRGGGDLARLFDPQPFPALYWAVPHLGLHLALTWRAARVALAAELSASERGACMAGLCALPWLIALAL
ncbi:hypothetical protein Pla86_00340 [Planctomycetes bacterium Pla86]|uniref:Uncharacterized protein n=2 Tax=Engelhardtia mirabilis TaxID=2528011 RepID=A0A518BDD3_9BACT|nr:hypothetical protein Pla133_00340 [Planctomycetes bacterium Pla133]QDU99298.1 hypothetical protein Pla86_00340 [Planctomycetes bacterium Pla86]